jgi:hypothetical protein
VTPPSHRKLRGQIKKNVDAKFWGEVTATDNTVQPPSSHNLHTINKRQSPPRWLQTTLRLLSRQPSLACAPGSARSIGSSVEGNRSRAKNGLRWIDQRRHVAVIHDATGRLVAHGFNFDGVHAEEAALKQLGVLMRVGRLKRRKMQNVTVTVYRVEDDPTADVASSASSFVLRKSKPCAECAALLKASPCVRSVAWSTGVKDEVESSRVCRL